MPLRIVPGGFRPCVLGRHELEKLEEAIGATKDSRRNLHTLFDILFAAIDKRSIGCLEAKGPAMELQLAAVTAYVSEYLIIARVCIVAAIFSERDNA